MERNALGSMHERLDCSAVPLSPGLRPQKGCRLGGKADRESPRKLLQAGLWSLQLSALAIQP